MYDTPYDVYGKCPHCKSVLAMNAEGYTSCPECIFKYSKEKIMSKDYSVDIPKICGLYSFKCEEGDNEAESVAITGEGSMLYAHSQDISKIPLVHFHQGLTNPRWKFIS